MAYTYILECSDGTYYCGSTRELTHRLAQHQRGEGSSYTRRRLPVTLVYYEMHEAIDHAYLREQKIQGWTHGKKRMLVRDGPGIRIES